MLINVLESTNYVKAIQSQVRSLRKISDSELKSQYSLFLQKLQTITITDKVDSKDIIRMFLDSDNKLYEDIQMIIHAICVSCVSFSVESNAESAISIYNIQNSDRRPIKEDSADNEMMICFNGPILSECDSIVRDALVQYLKK